MAESHTAVRLADVLRQTSRFRERHCQANRHHLLGFVALAGGGTELFLQCQQPGCHHWTPREPPVGLVYEDMHCGRVTHHGPSESNIPGLPSIKTHKLGCGALLARIASGNGGALKVGEELYLRCGRCHNRGWMHVWRTPEGLQRETGDAQGMCATVEATTG